jgi:hypothetical protein
MLDLARWRLNSGGPLRQYRRHHARRQPPDYFAGKIGGIAVESVDLQYADVARQVPVGVLARAVARRVEQRYCTERPLARMGTVVSSPRRPTAARTRRSINACSERSAAAQAPARAASVDRISREIWSANFSQSGETRQDHDLVALRGASVCPGFDEKVCPSRCRQATRSPARPAGLGRRRTR